MIRDAHIVGFQYAMYLFCGGKRVCQRYVMIHKVDDGSCKFAHIRFYKIRLSYNLGRQIGQVGGDNLVKMAFFIGFVKCFQTICKETESTADKDASGVHFF